MTHWAKCTQMHFSNISEKIAGEQPEPAVLVRFPAQPCQRAATVVQEGQN